MIRTFDAEFVNGLINHPDIHPWVTLPGQGHLDMSEEVRDERNYVLSVPGGAFFLHHVEPGIYEAHSLFLPEARGPEALNAAKDGMAFMFTNTDCETILARCPKGNLAVLAFTRALRFEFTHTKEKAWPTERGPVDERWFRMTRDRWASLQEN